jgi:hypothetical protein
MAIALRWVTHNPSPSASIFKMQFDGRACSVTGYNWKSIEQQLWTLLVRMISVRTVRGGNARSA